MITNFELIYEAIDPRRALLGLGALGGGLYGAYTLGNIGNNIGAFDNALSQADRIDNANNRDRTYNIMKDNPMLAGKFFATDKYADELDQNIEKLSRRHPEFSKTEYENAKVTGSAIGGLAGLGLGGLAGAGLTRLVVGKDPNKQKK